MLAQRLPGIVPVHEDAEAMEVDGPALDCGLR